MDIEVIRWESNGGQFYPAVFKAEVEADTQIAEMTEEIVKAVGQAKYDDYKVFNSKSRVPYGNNAIENESGTIDFVLLEEAFCLAGWAG